MTPKQRRFVAEYLVSLNATQAAIRAGYAARSAYQVGHELLRKLDIAAAIETARTRIEQKLEVDAERVIADAWHVLTADVRELVEYRVSCCRCCWGEDHRYQRTAGELERDRAAHERAEAVDGRPVVAFDEQGGIGYDAERGPNPACPECFGDGVGHVVMHDTRNVSPAAAMLYAGVRRTKDGISLLLRDKDAARETLMKHLGGYAKDNE